MSILTFFNPYYNTTHCHRPKTIRIPHSNKNTTFASSFVSTKIQNLCAIWLCGSHSFSSRVQTEKSQKSVMKMFFMFQLSLPLSRFLRGKKWPKNLLPPDKFYNIVMRSYELGFDGELKKGIFSGKSMEISSSIKWNRRWVS
jgi:hypothetical protein